MLVILQKEAEELRHQASEFGADFGAEFGVDEKTGHLTLSAAIGSGNTLIVVVDPSRGYVPLETVNQRAE